MFQYLLEMMVYLKTQIMQASQNNLQRNHALAVAALERQTAFDMQDQASSDAMWDMLGKFAMGMFKKGQEIKC